MRTAGRFLLGASVLAGIAISVTSAAFAQHSVRDAVYTNTADVAVGGGVEPSGGATVGRLAAVDVYVDDRGPATAKNVVLTAKLPTLSTFVSVDQSTGSCALLAGTLTCPLGDIPRYLEADLQIVLRMPSVPGPQVTTVHVHSSTPDPVKTNNVHSYTVNALARSHDSISSFIPEPGGTVSTGHRTSSKNPTSTTVQAHIEYSDPLTVAEHSTTDTAAACGSGYTCFGQYVTAGYVYGSLLKPSVATITFDSSEVQHHGSLLHVRLFDYGGIVPKCSAASDGAAKPDPCVASRLALPNGAWSFVVRFVYSVELRLGGVR